MQPINHVAGRAIPFGRKNVDTDVIIPAHWLKTITREGLGQGAFEAVKKEPGNVFTDPEFADAPILIAGDNFGCGSSREHAVWALKGYGIRCVIAPSFGEIFFNNCFKNMVLPLVLDEASIEAISAQIAEGQREVSVDLEAQTVTAPDGTSYSFEIDAARKDALLKGLDAIGVTLDGWDQIKAWQDADRAKRPWNYLD